VLADLLALSGDDRAMLIAAYQASLKPVTVPMRDVTPGQIQIAA
jgi:hypothetical protein